MGNSTILVMANFGFDFHSRIVIEIFEEKELELSSMTITTDTTVIHLPYRKH